MNLERYKTKLDIFKNAYSAVSSRLPARLPTGTPDAEHEKNYYFVKNIVIPCIRAAGIMEVPDIQDINPDSQYAEMEPEEFVDLWLQNIEIEIYNIEKRIVEINEDNCRLIGAL